MMRFCWFDGCLALVFFIHRCTLGFRAMSVTQQALNKYSLNEWMNWIALILSCPRGSWVKRQEDRMNPITSPALIHGWVLGDLHIHIVFRYTSNNISWPFLRAFWMPGIVLRVSISLFDPLTDPVRSVLLSLSSHLYRWAAGAAASDPETHIWVWSQPRWSDSNVPIIPNRYNNCLSQKVDLLVESQTIK